MPNVTATSPKVSSWDSFPPKQNDVANAGETGRNLTLSRSGVKGMGGYCGPGTAEGGGTWRKAQGPAQKRFL